MLWPSVNVHLQTPLVALRRIPCIVQTTHFVTRWHSKHKPPPFVGYQMMRAVLYLCVCVLKFWFLRLLALITLRFFSLSLSMPGLWSDKSALNISHCVSLFCVVPGILLLAAGNLHPLLISIIFFLPSAAFEPNDQWAHGKKNLVRHGFIVSFRSSQIWRFWNAISFPSSFKAWARLFFFRCDKPNNYENWL